MELGEKRMSAGIAEGLAAVINFFLSAIQLLVFASIIVTWVGDRSNQLVIMIVNLTEPIYRPLRRFTRRIPGPFDWAPMLVLALIIFIQIAGVAPLRRYAAEQMRSETSASFGQ
jgi:YggT family protein